MTSGDDGVKIKLEDLFSQKSSTLHLSSFKWRAGEDAGHLHDRIINELVRTCGNSVFCNEDVSALASSQELVEREVGQDVCNDKITFQDQDSEISEVVINDDFIGLRFENGTVTRISCRIQSPETSQEQSKSQRKNNVASFHMASDESYARRLQGQFSFESGAYNSPRSRYESPSLGNAHSFLQNASGIRSIGFRVLDTSLSSYQPRSIGVFPMHLRSYRRFEPYSVAPMRRLMYERDYVLPSLSAESLLGPAVRIAMFRSTMPPVNVSLTDTRTDSSEVPLQRGALYNMRSHMLGSESGNSRTGFLAPVSDSDFHEMQETLDNVIASSYVGPLPVSHSSGDQSQQDDVIEVEPPVALIQQAGILDESADGDHEMLETMQDNMVEIQLTDNLPSVNVIDDDSVVSVLHNLRGIDSNYPRDETDDPVNGSREAFVDELNGSVVVGGHFSSLLTAPISASNLHARSPCLTSSQAIDTPSHSGVGTVSSQVPNVSNPYIGHPEHAGDQRSNTWDEAKLVSGPSTTHYHSWKPALASKVKHEKFQMENGAFVHMTATKSGFYLIDFEGKMWFWHNKDPCPKACNFQWNQTYKVVMIGSNLLRISVLVESGQFVTFYDEVFSEYKNGCAPRLIQQLSHNPVLFSELMNESIVEIQCSNFFTAVHTDSGKALWWGLPPSSDRNEGSVSLSSRRSGLSDKDIAVGDFVALSNEDLNEIGSLVFNTTARNKEQIGVVLRVLKENDAVGASTKQKLIVRVKNLSKISRVPSRRDFSMFDEPATSVRDTGDASLVTLNENEEIWDYRDCIFLEEKSSFIGEVFQLDGPFAIVKPVGENASSELKVYFKTSLERLGSGKSSRFSLAEKMSRYDKFICNSPQEIVDEAFMVSCMSAHEHGISLLVSHRKDFKSYLVHPKGTPVDYAKWVTCSKLLEKHGKSVKSERYVTVEYESVLTKDCGLMFDVVEHNVSKCMDFSFASAPCSSLFSSNISHEESDLQELFKDSNTDSEAISLILASAEMDADLDELRDGQAKKKPGLSLQRSFSMPAGRASDRPDERNIDPLLFFNSFKDESAQGLAVNGRSMSRSFGRDSTVQRRKPAIFTCSFPFTCILFDNIGCSYPLRYDCCLTFPDMLECVPTKLFAIFDHGFLQGKDEKVITVLSVPKPSPAIRAITSCDKDILKVLFETEGTKINGPSAAKRKKVDSNTLPSVTMQLTNRLWLNPQFLARVLSERCSGHQNILHVCANNILPGVSDVSPHSSILDVRNDEETSILQKLLDTPAAWPRIRELLCERDAHGRTPFASAVIHQNLRGAYLILEAVKQNGRIGHKSAAPADGQLFEKAICTPTYSGLSPIHLLVQSSAKRQLSLNWRNTLKVCNLPAGYSPYMLLKLFKKKYPSVYRAVMPVPKTKWPPRTVRGKLKGAKDDPSKTKKKDEAKSSSQTMPQGAPNFRLGVPTGFPHFPLGARAPLSSSNRADMIRANAKEGLVMFGSAAEMQQALVEMNNFAVLSKADHPSGALLSVIQHLIHVQEYEERIQDYVVRKGDESDDSNSSSNASSKEETVSKCYDDIMVHLLFNSLMSCDPSITSLVNAEGETALAQFICTYPRFAPSHLHKMFLNWRPCNPTSCKYLRHSGSLRITCASEVQPKLPANRKTQDRRDKVSKEASLPSRSPMPFGRLAVPGLQASNSPTPFVNPLLMRRGLVDRDSTLRLTVPRSSGVEEVSSPSTASLQILEVLKFGPIEVSSQAGSTPVLLQPQTDVDKNFMRSSSPLFPRSLSGGLPPVVGTDSHGPTASRSEEKTSSSSLSPSASSSRKCTCHANKAKFLWNTTFDASVFILAKSMPCIISTVLCFQSQYSYSANADPKAPMTVVDSRKLDQFTERLLQNPFDILLEVFLKSIQARLASSKLYEKPELLVTLHGIRLDKLNFSNGKKMRPLYPWLTMQRFVRSLVRQLSLLLSKGTCADTSLKYKIGRHASKDNNAKETKYREKLNLSLRAFSWVSVIEILRAAEALIAPIRAGAVKAQPKGIMSEAFGSTSQIDHIFGGPFYPPNVPVQQVSADSGSDRRIIRHAFRFPSADVNAAPSPSSMVRDPRSAADCNRVSPGSGERMITQGASDDEDDAPSESVFRIGHEDRSFDQSTDSGSDDLSWDQQDRLNPDSPLAWAVDGHVRVYGDATRRNAAMLAGGGSFNTNLSSAMQKQLRHTPSIAASYFYLARMFSRLVKEAVDLAVELRRDRTEKADPPDAPFQVEAMAFPDAVVAVLRGEAVKLINSSWVWMKKLLNSIESQLQQGESFDRKHFVARLEENVARLEENVDSEPDFLGGFGARSAQPRVYGSHPDEYMVYLLKEETGEASDCLPILDLFSFAHVTYVLDAYLYMLQHHPFDSQASSGLTPAQHRLSPCASSTKGEGSSSDESMTVGASGKFYDGVRIADLRDHCRRVKFIADHPHVWLGKLSWRQMLMACDGGVHGQSGAVEHGTEPNFEHDVINDERGGSVGSSAVATTVDQAKHRWKRTISAFVSLFLTDGPVYERESFLANEAGGTGRISRFQRCLAAIRGPPNSGSYSSTAQNENPTLSITVYRSNLLTSCLKIFQENLDQHPFGSLRVRFETEEGTGPGVNRGLFAAFANVLKSDEKLKDWPAGFFEECGSLPEQRAIYTPVAGWRECMESSLPFDARMTPERRHGAFVAIGRFLGLSLWFNQTIPFILSRPTLKFLLNREHQITFDDLAFHNSALYDSFMHMIVDSKSERLTDQMFQEIYSATFEVPVRGGVEELVEGGHLIAVTKGNVMEYVRLYTQHLLIKCRENELLAMREGLQYMVSKELLDSLYAEDLQLLLSGGIEDVDYHRLRSLVTFSNSRGCARETLETYKSWFWKIIRRMTPGQRQQFLYFCTGSSLLPALNNRVGNNEEIAITVDIINCSTSALPIASTCGQRISVPLYDTKALLKRKLLQAIECQSYGLG